MTESAGIRVLVLLVLLSSAIAAQSPAVLEGQLIRQLKAMSQFGSYGGNYDDEKLSAATEAFKQTLVKNASRADVLAYRFPKLAREMFIATSPDRKLRVYSWDLESGGTMHDYDLVIQYRGRPGKVGYWTTSDEASDGGGAFYTDVFQLNTSSGPIYMLVSTSRASSSLNGQALRTMRIKGDELERDSKLIKTAEGMTNEISFAYDFFSVVDRPERPVKLFTFDAVRKEFKFPVVIEDDETPQGRVTNKLITYRFNGKHFVKVN